MDIASYFQALGDACCAIHFHEPTMGVIVAFCLAIFLLMCSAFVSASEIAFFSLTPSDINEIEEEKHSSDKSIMALRDDSERLLANILICNNLVNISIITLLDFVFMKVMDFCGSDVLQFLLMPLLAYGIGLALRLPKEQFIGLVMVGTVAGGTASNVIAYLAGGDVALSITMTACSTVAGIFLTPLLSSFYLGQTVQVSAWDMFKSILVVVALPVSLGLVINRLCRKHSDILAICSAGPLL